MSEVTVPDALSGEEILNAICEDVRNALKRDCHLNPYLAYMTYEAEIRIKIKLKDNGREPEVEQTIHSSLGSSEVRAEQLRGEAWSSSYVMEPERPPNVVRQESGQAIPVVVDTATGRKEMKSMKFAKRTEEPKEHEKKEHDPKNPQPGQPHPGQHPGQAPQQEPKK